MKTILIIAIIITGLLSLFSSFFYTQGWRITSKTIAFQYISLLLFLTTLLALVYMVKPDTILTILTCGLGAGIYLSLIYGTRYFAYSKIEGEGVHQTGEENPKQQQAT
jgi:hypothetical protein